MLGFSAGTTLQSSINATYLPDMIKTKKVIIRSNLADWNILNDNAMSVFEAIDIIEPFGAIVYQNTKGIVLSTN